MSFLSNHFSDTLARGRGPRNARRLLEACRPVQLPPAPYHFEAPEPPVPIAAATWQAGLTRNSEKFRVFIDGEPQPLAFAANVREGWAQLYVASTTPNANSNIARAGGLPITRRRYGRVELRSCPRD